MTFIKYFFLLALSIFFFNASHAAENVSSVPSEQTNPSQADATSDTSANLDDATIAALPGECTSEQIPDPYEKFNRPWFQFNEIFDKFVLKPLATLFNQLPQPVAKGFSNFFSNIDMIPTALNDLLQLNFYQFASDSWRFGFNTTIGLLGFFDVATQIGLPPNTQDLGLTLAHWGYTQSNYLVLPFFGPGTVRDQLAFVANYYYLTIYPYIQPPTTQFAVYSFGVVVRRADLLRYEALMEEASLDKYVFMRDAYIQHRNYLIARNRELANPCLRNKRLATESAGQQEVKTEEETRPFSDI